MSIPDHTTITLSCDENEEGTGPTIVHSTGVDNYRIQPAIIRLLQEAFTNDRLCDHEQGVCCTDDPATVIQAFTDAGFSEMSSSMNGDRKVWVLIKSGDGGDEDQADEEETD